ncbi:MAG: hypothetical protein K2Q18_08500 [Bdellovibrionales bacterium]|nr:hypothetical protein [Bdellovibrionales bacterium]
MKPSILALVICSFFSTVTFSKVPELSVTTDSKFSITTTDVASKLEDTLLQTEGFLKRFNPADAVVKKRVISGNNFDYIVEKKFLGISTEAEMIGTLYFERVATGCLPTENAYLGTFEFTGEQVIVDHIENFKMLVCSLEKNSTTINIRTKNTLNYKGDKLSYIAEKFVVGVIKDQVQAMNEAMKAEVLSR